MKMKSKMIVATMFAAVFFTTVAKAQSVENARKMFFYERYKTAKDELQKLVAANPGNVEANYWLVNTLLQLNDKAGAIAAADVASKATNNAPWIQVVQGQLDLIEGKKAEAKSKFETAITAGDKKTLPGILNAIGRANGTVGISQSEPDYAIEKLRAAALKDPKNSDIFINIGDCYRRKLDGGEAVRAYMEALRIDPNNALAYFRMGQIYQTQDNCPPMKENYTKAVGIDPNFMAAWRELFDVYGDKESKCYNKEEAKNYLDKYIASADQGLETDKIRMRFCYYTDDFNCAINEIDKIQAKYGADADVDLYRWKAYIYKDMGDSIKGCQAFADFFAKEKDQAKIGYRVYIRAAEVCSKIAGNEQTAIGYYLKSISVQPDNKLNVPAFAKLGDMYDKLKDYSNSAIYFKKVIENKETPSAGNLFMGTVAHYKASQYAEGANIAKMYAEKYPTDYRGTFWAARNYAQLDSTGQLGTAVPEYEKFITIAETDKAKNKSNLIEAYKYVFVNKATVVKDMATAKSYLDKLKMIDSTNAAIPDFEIMLTGRRPATRTPATTPATIPKPGTKPAAASKPAASTSTKATTTTGTKPAVAVTPKPGSVTKPSTTVAPKTGVSTKPVPKPVKKPMAAKK